MEINISDEMIEKIVEEQVKAKVNQHLADRTKDNPYWISDMYRNCVAYEVRKIYTDEFVQGICKELSKDGIAERVIDRFAERIASCFEY